jgi:hypothetical protein
MLVARRNGAYDAEGSQHRSAPTLESKSKVAAEMLPSAKVRLRETRSNLLNIFAVLSSANQLEIMGG